MVVTCVREKWGECWYCFVPCFVVVSPGRSSSTLGGRYNECYIIRTMTRHHCKGLEFLALFPDFVTRQWRKMRKYRRKFQPVHCVDLRRVPLLSHLAWTFSVFFSDFIRGEYCRIQRNTENCNRWHCIRQRDLAKCLCRPDQVPRTPSRNPSKCQEDEFHET